MSSGGKEVSVQEDKFLEKFPNEDTDKMMIITNIIGTQGKLF